MHLVALGPAYLKRGRISARTTNACRRECHALEAASVIPWALDLGPKPSKKSALVRNSDGRFGLLPLDALSSVTQAMPNAGAKHDMVVRSGLDLPAVE